MSGLIFGVGALVFKDITEGLGCLLGGFCLSMWFLVLKPGGLVTSTGGKAIFIAAFCIAVWSLSFSHYTRAYGLIGSTSFSGSTAFVLGIDCFSKGGLKEFWIYLWGLNNNLFPLNTNTYPITKGTRVEIIVVILGTIIGIVSQIKLWKVVKDRQRLRQEAQKEDDRRRDAVEEALGRHLERQNDRDRSEWERRYGDRLNAKRNTVLWTDPHSEGKQFPSTSTTEVESSERSESKESLEMNQIPPVSKPALYSSRSKRHSAMSSVQPIQEVEEEEHISSGLAEWKRASVLAESKPGEFLPQLLSEKFTFETDNEEASKGQAPPLEKTDSRGSVAQVEKTTSLRPSNSKPSSKRTADRLHVTDTKKRSSRSSLDEFKRRSVNSMKSLSPVSGDKEEFSESKEALVLPDPSHGSHSRASSVAATMDDEHDSFDVKTLDDTDLRRSSIPPQILISPAANFHFSDFKLGFPEPPSPSGLSDSFDADPEAIIRPSTNNAHGFQAPGLGKTNAGGSKSADPNHVPNSEALTKGALEQVPSQMSNVILSYRTNEWAKHIATAEIPVYEEPDPIVLHDGEQPVHLADPASLASTGSPSGDLPKPPPIQTPLTSVAPSEAGLKVNPELKPIEGPWSKPGSVSEKPMLSPTKSAMEDITSNKPGSPALSQTETPQQLSAAPSRSTSVTSTSNPNRRSFTDPVQQTSSVQAPSSVKTSRRTSNPMTRQPSLVQKSTIDENIASDFNPRSMKRSSTTTSLQGYQRPNPYGTTNADSTRPHTGTSPAPVYPSAFMRAPSPGTMRYQNVSSPNLLQYAPSASPNIMQHPTMGMRSDTRLADHSGKTHQPLQRNNTNESRRENLMADWRMQLAQSHTTEIVPVGQVDGRYAQQMMDYEAHRIRQEQIRQQRARQEVMMDQSMRTQGMIEAHREVLKKMQSRANEKLTK